MSHIFHSQLENFLDENVHGWRTHDRFVDRGFPSKSSLRRWTRAQLPSPSAFNSFLKVAYELDKEQGELLKQYYEDTKQPDGEQSTAYNYFGRAEEHLQLKRKLGIINSKSTCVQTAVIYGPHGLGKTRLVKELMQEKIVTESFPDGIIFVDMRNYPSFQKLGHHIVSELKIDELPTDEPALTNMLKIYLESHKLLLIADDVNSADHIIPIQNVLGKNSCLLATSTRLSQVNQLVHNSKQQATSMRLKPLAEDSALELLTYLTQQDLMPYAEELKHFFSHIDYSPLAIHGLASIFNSYELYGLKPSFQKIFENKGKNLFDAIVSQYAPSDRYDFGNQAVPTISDILAKSIKMLYYNELQFFEELWLNEFSPKVWKYGQLVEIGQTNGLNQMEVDAIIHSLIEKCILNPVYGNAETEYRLSTLVVRSYLNQARRPLQRSYANAISVF